MTAKRRTSAGGAAGAGGSRYAARVAAFHAVAMLSEQSAVLGWERPAGTSIEAIAAETDSDVDDIKLGLSDGTEVLLQAKRRVTAATGANGPLAKTVDEFVRQHRGDGGRGSPLVLVCGAGSGAVVDGLPPMLRRLRDEQPGDVHAVVATNKNERAGWAALLSVTEAAWQKHLGSPPLPEDLVALLSRVFVDVLDVEDGGRDEERALDRLADAVLADPAQAATVWRGLVERMLGLAAGQRGITRGRLQAVLATEGVQLGVLRSFRDDVAALRARTTETVRRLSRHRKLPLGLDGVEIAREARAGLRKAATECSFFVVGPPGIGKSGLLADVIADLHVDDVDVVALRAEDLSARTPDELRRELGLGHTVPETLGGWPGRTGVLVIDGLDAARGADATHTLVTLIDDVVAMDSRWHVVASVRSFDLRHHRGLRATLPGGAVHAGGDPEFADVSHFAVPELTESELGGLQHSAPGLHALLAGASPPLRSLVLNVFNLSLLADLSGILPAERLTRLTTQLELLSLHWTSVVTAPVDERAGREDALRALCRLAASHLALQVSRDEVLRELVGCAFWLRGKGVWSCDAAAGFDLGDWAAAVGAVAQADVVGHRFGQRVPVWVVGVLDGELSDGPEVALDAVQKAGVGRGRDELDVAGLGPVEWTRFDGHLMACVAWPRKDVSVDAENAPCLSR